MNCQYCQCYLKTEDKYEKHLMSKYCRYKRTKLLGFAINCRSYNWKSFKQNKQGRSQLHDNITVGEWSLFNC